MSLPPQLVFPGDANLVGNSTLTKQQKNEFRIAHPGVLVGVGQNCRDEGHRDHLHDRVLTETRRFPEPAPPGGQCYKTFYGRKLRLFTIS